MKTIHIMIEDDDWEDIKHQYREYKYGTERLNAKHGDLLDVMTLEEFIASQGFGGWIDILGEVKVTIDD